MCGCSARPERELCSIRLSRKWAWACIEAGPRCGAIAAGGAKCCCVAPVLLTLSLLLLSDRVSTAAGWEGVGVGCDGW